MDYQEKGPDFSHVPALVGEAAGSVIRDGGGLFRVGGHIVRVPPRQPYVDIMSALAIDDIARRHVAGGGAAGAPRRAADGPRRGRGADPGTGAAALRGAASPRGPAAPSAPAPDARRAPARVRTGPRAAVPRGRRALLAPVLILGLSLALRLVGLGWGIPAWQPGYLAHGLDRPSYHLDEDNFLWGQIAVAPARPVFDLHDLHWGTLQFFLIDGALLVGQAAGVVPAPWQAAYVRGDATALPQIFLIGRLVSALAGVAATAAALGLGAALEWPARRSSRRAWPTPWPRSPWSRRTT